MKTMKTLLWALLCIGATACSDDESTRVEARIVASIGDAQTRAVESNWNGDRIGVRVTSSTSGMAGTYQNVPYQTTSTGSTATFTAVSAPIYFQDGSETVTFAAYAPYQTSAANALPGGDGKVSFDTSVSNTSATQESIDFLYASGATASNSSPTVTFTGTTAFQHKMQRLQLTLTADNGFIASDIFSLSEIILGGLTHEGTFDVTTGDVALTGSTVSDWSIKDAVHTDGAASRTYSLILAPQDLTSSPLTLSITIGGQTYTNSSLISGDLEGGKSYDYSISVCKTGITVSGCTITPWDNQTGGNGFANME